MKIAITRFKGEVPRVDARLLDPSAAQVARAAKLEEGSLLPMRQPDAVYAIGSPAQTIYRSGAAWLTWASPVSVVPAPIAADRLYITNDGAPKIRVGGSTYNLAVPAPAGALTVALASGTPDPDTVRTVLYCYTYVTSFDEESEPSPLSNALLWSEGLDVTLSGFALPPAGRAIDRQRIYRSQMNALGETQLFLIKERVASAANFTDVVANNPIQELLPSLDYNPPPAGLSGLVAMPNGMMAAFSGKSLYFCEPYRPHAWPEKYILSTDFEIVGLGVFGSSLAVLTVGQPYIVTGTAPDSMQMEKLEINLPCLSARGIVDLGYSIAYPSPDGLVIINTSGAQLVSRSLFTRDQWQRLNPSSFVSSVYAGRYVASYTPLSGAAATIILDLAGDQFFVSHAPQHATAMFSEIGTGALYFVVGTTIYEWDALTEPPAALVWRSKQFVLNGHTNFSAFLADVEAVPGDHDTTFTARIYADGALKATIDTINEPARLPGGFLARTWEIEVETNAKVTALALANAPYEFAA